MGSDCVPQGCIQMGLEILRGWRLHDFSGPSILMLDCWEFFHDEEIFINVQTGTTFLNFNLCLLSFALLPWIT